MKSKLIMAIICSCYILNVSAQFTEDFEYEQGEPLGEWWLCGQGGGNCVLTGGGVGYIPGDGTSEALLDLGSQVSGIWSLEFEMYIASNKEAYFNLQGEIPVSSGEWIVGNIFFNQDLASPGVGSIDDTALGEVTFDFPHDQWFTISFTVDMSNGISTAVWEFNVDAVNVVPQGTLFTNAAGTVPTSLGGVDFFSISANNEYYLDNMVYSEMLGNSNGVFEDDMEDYVVGEPILNNWWGSWSSGSQGALTASSEQALSGTLSGLVPGNGFSDPELNLGNKTSDKWALAFYMYVPNDREAYWNLQGTVPIGAGEWIVGNIFFNQDLASPGVGLIDNSALGPVNFNFPHNQWFQVVMNVDLTNGMSSGTWELYIADNEVIPSGTAFTDFSGTVPTSLGGINFFSISTNNEFYLDDFNYIEGEILGIDASGIVNFDLFPNPTTGLVTVETSGEISTITIYNLQGQLMDHTRDSNFIDISGMASGMYFIEVVTNEGKSTKKLIRE